MKQMRKLVIMLLTMLLVFMCSFGAFAVEEGTTDPETDPTPVAPVEPVVTKKKGLVEDKNGIHFYYKGAKIKNKWKTVDGKKYYFNKKGNALTGAQKVSGKYYLFNGKGVLQQPKSAKFISLGNKRYYVYASGQIRTGWFMKGKYLYYGNPSNNGRLVVGKKYQNVQFNNRGEALKSNNTGKVKYKSYEIVNRITKSSQSSSSKLYSCWRYITSTGGFHYYAPYSPTSFGRAWQHRVAYQFLTTKRGTCTGFACGFAALADACGYNATIVRGGVSAIGGGFTGHSWVQIGGLTYDPDGAYENFVYAYASHGYPIAHYISSKYSYRGYV